MIFNKLKQKFKILFFSKKIRDFVSSKCVTDKYGNKRWYKSGTEELHREDGPAVEWANGSKRWYLNGKCHREDGPAVEWANGSKRWYLNDKLHREDGPAIEWADGDKWWYLNGKKLTEEEWREQTLYVRAQITGSFDSEELFLRRLDRMMGNTHVK